MALQGNIDSFAVVDVLRLLGSSSKSGHLLVSGERGTSGLWVRGGEIVGGDGGSTGPATTEDGLVDVMFNILRNQTGTFAFDGDAVVPAGDLCVPIERLVSAAELSLAEWNQLVSHVPSMLHGVSLAPELPNDSVTIDRRIWSAIGAIGNGAPVEVVGRRLGLGEVPSIRLVHDMMELGVVVLNDPVPAPSLMSVPSEVLEDVPPPYESGDVEELVDEFEVPEVQDSSLDLGTAVEFDAPADPVSHVEIEAEPVVEPQPIWEPEPQQSMSEPLAAEHATLEEILGDFDASTPRSVPVDDLFAPVAQAPVVTPQPWDAPAPQNDADELARQMALLSPRAAHAVASANQDGTVDNEERARLAKFLGSV